MSEQPIMRASTSMVTYRVGGREYPMRTNRQCKVCMSPHRFDIEQDLVSGRTYQKIIDHLPEDADLTSRNVKDHYLNNHMPLDITNQRAIIEAQAQRVGKRIEDGAEELVDGVTLAKSVVMKTFEDIASGRIQPEVRDGLRAMKLLADLGEYDEAGGLDMAALTDAFVIYHENARAHMSAEQFSAFEAALESNPVLKALESKAAGERHDTIPGEVTASKEEAH